jgi:hypothetical protein
MALELLEQADTSQTSGGSSLDLSCASSFSAPSFALEPAMVVLAWLPLSSHSLTVQPQSSSVLEPAAGPMEGGRGAKASVAAGVKAPTNMASAKPLAQMDRILSLIDRQRLQEAERRCQALQVPGGVCVCVWGRDRVF